jgi:hypothetical protein
MMFGPLGETRKRIYLTDDIVTQYYINNISRKRNLKCYLTLIFDCLANSFKYERFIAFKIRQEAKYLQVALMQIPKVFGWSSLAYDEYYEFEMDNSINPSEHFPPIAASGRAAVGGDT